MDVSLDARTLFINSTRRQPDQTEWKYSLLNARVTNHSPDHSVALEFGWNLEFGREATGLEKVVRTPDNSPHLLAENHQYHDGILRLEPEDSKIINLVHYRTSLIDALVGGGAFLYNQRVFIRAIDQVSGKEREYRVPTTRPSDPDM